MFLFYVLSFFKKGGTIQGNTVFIIMTKIMTICMHKDIKSNNTTRGELLSVSKVDKGETKGVEF